MGAPRNPELRSAFVMRRARFVIYCMPRGAGGQCQVEFVGRGVVVVENTCSSVGRCELLELTKERLLVQSLS